MSESPSPNGPSSSTRGAGGRFIAGNPGGPGNPHARRVGELRSALLSAISDEDWLAVLKKLIERAKAGELAAIRELLDRTIGKPVEPDILERIERLEAYRKGQLTHENQLQQAP